MRPLLRFAALVDRLSEFVGRIILWLVLVMVLIGAGNAGLRYVGRFAGSNLSSNAFIELQWYLFSMIFLLGAAYALRHDSHVRVDVIYARLSLRARTWIDLLGTVLFLIPFSALMLFVSYPTIRNSWQVREMSPDPGGLPRYPIKATILIAFALLILQGFAELIKQIAILRGITPPDTGMTEEAKPIPQEGV